MFKLAAKELQENFIDFNSKTVVVNMTWMQMIIAKVL